MFKYFYYLALLLYITTNSKVFAANLPSNNESIEVVTITAERLAVTELLSPYSTTVIYEDEIINNGIRTTVDALGMVPGVLVQKTAHGQGSPYIRGFTGFRNVFLIDGVRLNNAVFREGPNQYWNTVDPNSIAKFEVVKGPTSVVYGSDAIGGAVNAITKIQSMSDLDSEPLATLAYRGATAEQSNVVRASFAQKLTDSSAFTSGFSFKDYGNLIAGKGTREQPNTGYDEYNIDLKWLTLLSSDLPLTVAYFKTKQNKVPRTHKTVDAISFAGTSIGNELKRDLDQNKELIYIKLDIDKQSFFLDGAQFTLSHHKQSEFRNRIRTNNRIDQQGFDVSTLGFNANLFKKKNSNNLVYGFEYYRDKVNSFSSKSEIQGPIADDSYYQWFGLYGQNKYTFSNKFNIDYGTRWSYISVNAKKIQDPLSGDSISMKNHWNDIVINLRGNLQTSPKSQSFYFGFSQGFRAPNLSDLTRFDSARSNEFEIPALQLEPEHYLTFDTGVKFRSSKFNYNVALYYTKIEDQIQRVLTGNKNIDNEFEITKSNIGNGYNYGGELDISYMWNPQIKLQAHLAYINGKVDTLPDSGSNIEREYLSRLMPINMNITVNYTSPSDDWWASSSFTAYSKADRLSSRDKSDTQRIPPGGTPSFTVWDIGGGYNVSKSMKLIMNLNNVLNKNYRIHGSGQNEAGINFIVNIEYQF
jgi:hemoglobin/transferrin/lactoferrin receptor protein